MSVPGIGPVPVTGGLSKPRPLGPAGVLTCNCGAPRPPTGASKPARACPVGRPRTALGFSCLKLPGSASIAVIGTTSPPTDILRRQGQAPRQEWQRHDMPGCIRREPCHGIAAPTSQGVTHMESSRGRYARTGPSSASLSPATQRDDTSRLHASSAHCRWRPPLSPPASRRTHLARLGTL